ncbi:hypothetical protein [Yoonia sediminilitoris]|uniref:Beta/gamma crystallin n=1 Tax=Yoonia sediminilitoris TaxID=1286148 RepID=A0A2T6KEN6_9RHOB|nr:hypothetical protein [Yoonia sediminilitoris]PUB13583.1 hypothetical protein C8N45_10742 [Yoonia sediminilitoris]RCW94753.1 hypothetical protein DFP92_10742 [Yoonia sediminilitoris]
MLRQIGLTWAAALLATMPLAAQDIMDGAAFDAHVTGRTITFRTDTTDVYGVERYMPGRRVMWSSVEGICQYGVWFESKGDICFRYDHDPEHKCWTIYDEPGGIRGVYTTSPPYTVIYEVPDADTPLICNDLSS